METQVRHLEQVEIDEQCRNMLIDYETQTELLARRQKQEMDAMTTAHGGRVARLERARDKGVSAAKQRILNLQSELRTLVPRGRQMFPTARGPARTAPMNMIHICTVQLQPLVPGQGRRAAAIFKRK
jgi:hypothetical protein